MNQLTKKLLQQHQSSLLEKGNSWRPGTVSVVSGERGGTEKQLQQMEPS